MKGLERIIESYPSHTMPGLPNTPTRNPRDLATRTANGAKSGPSPAAASKVIHRMLALVDTRLVGLLAVAYPDQARDDEARMELTLLWRLDRTLRAHLSQLERDVVICNALIEFAYTIPPIIADLGAGGARRCQRFLDLSRELLTELVVLGAAAKNHRQTLAMARHQMAQLDTPPLAAGHTRDAARAAALPAALAQAVALCTTLHAELDAHSPRRQESLLDAWVRRS